MFDLFTIACFSLRYSYLVTDMTCLGFLGGFFWCFCTQTIVETLIRFTAVLAFY